MIIITTYHGRNNDSRFSNRRKYLEETIRSIDNQCLENLFHLIIDDGSTDDTYNVLHTRYAHDNRRRILRREKGSQEPLTSTNARNFALDLCLSNHSIDGVNISEHEYIAFIDSDDVVIDLQKREEFLTKNKPDFLYTDVLLFFNNTDTAYLWKGLNPQQAYKNFWIHGKMPYPSMTWGIDFLKKLREWTENHYGFKGPFDSHIGCGEDVDVALSSLECAQERNSKIGYLPEVTAGYRIHNSSLATIRNQKTRVREENSVLKRHFGNVAVRYLHLRRFLVRPECYIPYLMEVKNILRKKTSKQEFFSRQQL